MFALDTNILVHAHNLDSPLCTKAKEFVGKVITQEDSIGNTVGLYTVNVDDFKDFSFLQVINPLA